MWEERAIQILKTKNVSTFEVEDTFNGNLISGVISTEPDYRYGALVIFKINDEMCEQVVFATPKLHYPFDRNGNYFWPEVKEVQVWDKLDGTNVFSYRYTYRGEEFVTFKTRLTPVIKDSSFASFKSLWKEYMSSNDWVKKVIENNPNYNLSFELYGRRNPITIKYDVPLEVSLLFGIRRRDNAIKPPTELKLVGDEKLPLSYGQINSPSKEELTKYYNNLRQKMSEKNKSELLVEGTVIYAQVGEPSWQLFKCKPEEIEKIHWSASGSIPIVALRNTALNVFESVDNPTFQDFETLLLEEYSKNMISRCQKRVQKVWEWALEQVKITKEVNRVWSLAKEKGFDVCKDKVETLRFISNYFPKSMMSKVGGIILTQSGLLKKDK